MLSDNRNIELVPVLAVCKPDWHLAKKWLEWARHLQRLDRLVLLTSSDLTWAQIYALQQLAYRVASTVRIHHPNGFEEIGYFGGANQMFISALTYCEEYYGEHAMLWIEADTCPMRPNWFDEISHEYRLCGRPFMGDIHRSQIDHMTGNAVYHPNWRKLAPSLALLPGPRLEQGWDSQCAHETLPQCAQSETIRQWWRPPVITEEWLEANVPPEVALFHQCKDGSMIDVLCERFELRPIPLDKPLAVTSYPPAPAQNAGGAMPKVEILIVTFARDMEFLRYCLKGIRDHASGFAGVKVSVPLHEREKFAWIKPKDAIVSYFVEPPGKGMMAHEIEKCRADLLCPNADFILHLDADTIPFRRFTPGDYINVLTWRALMVRENYNRITNPNRHVWRETVKAAAGIDPKWDCMVRHPQVHPRAVYPLTRRCVELHTGKPFEEYVFGCKNDFPQGFAEFPTLCAVGLAHLEDSYAPAEYDKEADAKLISGDINSFQYVYRRDRNHFIECWSHGGIDRYRSDIEAVLSGRIPEYWVK